ncbi:MAG: phosphoglucosamine mutase [Candidatus Sumerlaeota bacterium]|nr:phosphoglucosamine mutase [Candidatus Sumerlaeota bacterium]
MSKPIISVAGIRGIVGDSLVPEEFLRYALAYAAQCKGHQIVVGGDSRLSRHMVRRLVFAALESSGFEAVDLGVCPTPTVGLMVGELGAAGGIAITASHNPAEWNALKFFSSEGVFLNQEEFDRVMRAYEASDFRRASFAELGRVLTHPDPIGPHVERAVGAVNQTKIRLRKLRAAVDCCNGAGAVILPRLCKSLGIDAEFIFTDMSVPFERPAEPLPENLGTLCRTVQAVGADVGFAVDPDADRLALVDETGRAIGEERTLTLVANHYLAKEKTPLVANLSTTRALDDVARAHGVPLYRTKIGEAHVVAEMKRVGSRIGGEGNGGVIAPRIHLGRDAAAGVALICEALAEGKCSLSALNAKVPDYMIVKAKVSIEGRSVAEMLPKIERALPTPKSKSTLDGLKLDYESGWVHVRPSGTEPIIRIFAEAPTEAQAREWVETVLAIP